MLERNVKFQLIDCIQCYQRSLVPIALDQRPRGDGSAG